MDLFDISLSRGIASLSLVLNVACQVYYAFLANPSIKQVADAYPSAFSPHPYFITAFFVLQVVVQSIFVRDLFDVTATPDEPTLFERFGRFARLTSPSSNSNPVEPVQTFYSLVLAIGNLFHVAWTVFWMQGWFWAALPMVAVNTLLQLHASCICLDPYVPGFSPPREWPAYVISKSAAGVGLLGVLDTAATATGYTGPPSAAVQIIVVFLFIKLAGISDGNGLWNCAILFDAIALCAGQPGWSASLAITALFIVLETYIVFFSPCAAAPW